MRLRGPSTSRRLNATTMRIILSIGLVLILAAMSAGFYFSYLYLKEVSAEVASVQAEADSSDSNLQALMKTRQQLADSAVTVEKAQQIVAESQSYRYQDQVVTDISEYGRRANVPIASFTFQAQAAASGTTTAPAAAPTPGGAPDPSTGAPAPAAPVNQTTSVTVQLGDNIGYANLLHFLHLIEESLTRMQITQLSLSKGADPATVNAQTLNIEVYLR